jgi:hypothetical protein
MKITSMPVIIHSNAAHSGPWTDNDTKMAIAVWLAFTIIGLTGLLVEYIRYKRSNTDDSFIEFVEENDSYYGLLTIWPSILVNSMCILGLLIYGIYSIL